MRITTLLTVLLLTFAVPASAQLGVVTAKAYEVDHTTVRLPASKAGSLAFRPCAECEYMTRRVTAQTRWTVNHETVSFEDFRRSFYRRTGGDMFITVVHHLESDVIQEVAITIF